MIRQIDRRVMLPGLDTWFQGFRAAYGLERLSALLRAFEDPSGPAARRLPPSLLAAFRVAQENGDGFAETLFRFHHPGADLH